MEIQYGIMAAVGLEKTDPTSSCQAKESEMPDWCPIKEEEDER